MSFVKIIRRPAAEFESGLILDDDQIGFETDTKKFKIGDSSTTWANLLYADPTAVIAALALKADSLTAADATARLALTGLTRGARVYQTDNGFWYELTNAAAPSDAASWQGMPKKYVASLTQTGTDAPVATVLENSLGGTVVWTYVGAGSYLGTLSNAFTADKTVNLTPFWGDTTDLANSVFRGVLRASVSTLSVLTTDGGTPTNGMLDGSQCVSILVYP